MASRRPIAMLDAAVLLLLLSCAAALAPATGASSDAAALLAFKSAADPGNRLAFPPPSSNGSADHCRWPGVFCSASGRVVRVVLVNSGISGFFTSGTLDRLDQLRILSLQDNSLAGPIPDLSLLLNLRALYLGHNRFGGSFPLSIVSLHRLRVLDLSRNHLAGPVPPALASLDRLVEIRLDFNRFDGFLPAFNRSSLKSLNVSFNNFSGAIPTTAVLSSFATSSFSGNPGLCGEILKKECGDGAHILFFHGSNDSHNAPSPPSPNFAQNNGINLPGAESSSPSHKMHKRVVVAIWLLAVSMLAIGILGVLLVAQRRRKRMKRGEILSPVKSKSYGGEGVAEPAAAAVESYNKEIESRNNELMAAAVMAVSEEKVKKLAKSGCLVFCSGEAQVYTLEQLLKSSAEMLGRGSLGTTYRAVLENRLIVTVKRLNATKLAATGKEAFERHMEVVVGRLRHPNLVPLRAYFQAKEERLLVYDYKPNGSLHSLIHGSRSTGPKPLHWTSCLKIAEDVAQGLAYIHQASRLVHGNIKSSNILLGSDFEACLTDNCLSFLVEPSDSENISGYRVPETEKSNGPFTPKSDIYCFGVLLLELLTGKSPLQHPILSATHVPAWVQSTREDGGDDERLMMIADIAAACVQPSPDSRPTTWQVLKMIQEVKEADTGDDDSNAASLS